MGNDRAVEPCGKSRRCVCACGELMDTVRIRKWREKWRKKGGRLWREIRIETERQGRG